MTVGELADYDLVLKHKPEKENKIADALSQQPDYDTGGDDNKGVVVLPETMFIKFTMLKKPPSSSLNESIITAQTTNFALLDPLIQPHNLFHFDNFWWKGDTLVVVGDNNLKKGVLHPLCPHLLAATLCIIAPLVHANCPSYMCTIMPLMPASVV